MVDDRAFPEALCAVAEIEFDLGEEDGDQAYELVGVDYEPFGQFQPADDLNFWFRLWPGTFRG